MIAQTTPQQTPDENDRRGAGSSQPVAPIPVVPEQKQTKDAAPANNNADAAVAEKAAPAAAPVSVAGKLAADSVQLAYKPAGSGAYDLYSGSGSNMPTNNYAASPNGARPFYGNAYMNHNQSFSRAFENMQKRQAADQSEVPVLRGKMAATPRLTTKDTDKETTPAVAVNAGTGVKDVTIAATDAEDARQEPRPTIALKKKAMLAPADDADELYDRKDYKAALAAYNRDINHSNKARRHYAIMGAARCYLNMGQKVKARQLLQGLADEGGAQSRAARKMLRKMDGEAQ
jgi:tetratricopeptide (TPR) repeat protein